VGDCTVEGERSSSISRVVEGGAVDAVEVGLVFGECGGRGWPGFVLGGGFDGTPEQSRL
jgi:hypothetical protein